MTEKNGSHFDVSHQNGSWSNHYYLSTKTWWKHGGCRRGEANRAGQEVTSPSGQGAGAHVGCSLSENHMENNNACWALSLAGSTTFQGGTTILIWQVRYWGAKRLSFFLQVRGRRSTDQAHPTLKPSGTQGKINSSKNYPVTLSSVGGWSPPTHFRLISPISSCTSHWSCQYLRNFYIPLHLTRDLGSTVLQFSLETVGQAAFTPCFIDIVDPVKLRKLKRVPEY